MNENKTNYLLEKVIKQMNNRSYNMNKYNGFLNKLKYKKNFTFFLKKRSHDLNEGLNFILLTKKLCFIILQDRVFNI